MPQIFPHGTVSQRSVVLLLILQVPCRGPQNEPLLQVPCRGPQSEPLLQVPCRGLQNEPLVYHKLLVHTSRGEGFLTTVIHISSVHQWTVGLPQPSTQPRPSAGPDSVPGIKVRYDPLSEDSCYCNIHLLEAHVLYHHRVYWSRDLLQFGC